MAYQFDYENALINVTSPQTDVDVQELLNEIRAAEADLNLGVVYDQIATASGKEDLGGGTYVGITVNLLDNWQIKFWSGDYIAKIAGGNLVGGPGGDPVAYSSGVQTLLIQSAASTLIIFEGTSGLTEDESDALLALENNVARALGLMQENFQIDQCTYTTYQGMKLMTAGRIRVWSDSASVGTTSNIIAEYQITSNWTNDEMDDYTVVKQ
jgi:hypothetical protein